MAAMVVTRLIYLVGTSMKKASSMMIAAPMAVSSVAHAQGIWEYDCRRDHALKSFATDMDR